MRGCLKIATTCMPTLIRLSVWERKHEPRKMFLETITIMTTRSRRTLRGRDFATWLVTGWLVVVGGVLLPWCFAGHWGSTGGLWRDDHVYHCQAQWLHVFGTSPWSTNIKVLKPFFVFCKQKPEHFLFEVFLVNLRGVPFIYCLTQFGLTWNLPGPNPLRNR